MRKYLIVVYGLFCLFSDGAVSAAAASASIEETKEGAPKTSLSPVLEWEQLKEAVVGQIKPFDFSPVFTTGVDTKKLIDSVGSVFDQYMKGEMKSTETAASMRCYLRTYSDNEPSKYTYYKDAFGNITSTVKYTAEEFSVPVDNALQIFTEERGVKKYPGRMYVGRAAIYKTVKDIIENFASFIEDESNKSPDYMMARSSSSSSTS